MTHLRYLLLPALVACGGAPAASTAPSNVASGPAHHADHAGSPDDDGAGAATTDLPYRRGEAECAALLAHIEALTNAPTEDPIGMMDMCRLDWDEVRFHCLANATDDDDVTACW